MPNHVSGLAESPFDTTLPLPGVLAGQPELLQESIETYEVQGRLMPHRSLDMSATLYHYEIEDEVILDVDRPRILVYQTSGLLPHLWPDAGDLMYDPALDGIPVGLEFRNVAEGTTGKGGELEVLCPDGREVTLRTPMAGEHNARNALAATILAHEGAGLDLEAIGMGLASFGGVALRQQLVGSPADVRVYRDFAHHPEAVGSTIRAMRPVAGAGRLIAAYEPRTATACRALHQQEYVEAFVDADEVVLAPVARTEIPLEERLSTDTIASELGARGIHAPAAGSLDELVDLLAETARGGDLVLRLSNGHFGGVDRRLVERLEARS